MSRTISKCSCNDMHAVTFQDSWSCSNRDEPSEPTKSVTNSKYDDSQCRDGSSPVRWFGDGDADGSFATSPQVSPSGLDEQDDQPCDRKIQQIQRMHISKGISILDFFASCDTNCKPNTDYNPQEYLYGPTVPAPSGPESKSTDFYDDTLSPDDTLITKRSGVMIASFSKSMNFLLEQEAIDPDIPKNPAFSVVLSSSDSAFSVSADASDIELRDTVDNIVQTLNVTDVTKTDSLADLDSGSVKLPLMLGSKEDKPVDLLVVANRDTTGHRMESVVEQERNESVAVRSPTEQNGGERQRGDDPLEYTSAAHGCSGSSQGETVGGNHMKSDGVLCTQTQLQSEDNQDPRLEASVIIIEPTEPNHVMHDQSLNQTVVPCRYSVGATRTPSEEDQAQLCSESLDRTIVPNCVQNWMKPGKQESATDCTLISPNDSLGNDHLRWNDSSTPDSIQAPIGPIVTAKAAVADADPAAVPIKLDPITKDMRYTRSSGRKSALSARKKKVHFKEATSPRKEEVQPCYRTQWSTQIEDDPYDYRHIQDDSGDQLFSNKQSSGSKTAASDEDEDKCALIKSFLSECSKDFERSMSTNKKRVTKGKQKSNRKHTQAVQKTELLLVNKDLLRDAVASVLQTTKATESKKTQTDPCVETNDVAVQTPRRYPSDKSRKTTKAKVKPPPREDPKQITLTQYVSRRSPEREPPGNVMPKGSFRKPPPSFTTTPSIELSSVSISPTIDCENEAPASINSAEHPGFFRLLDDLRLSPVASIHPEVDDVCASQQFGASIITSGEYVCTIRDRHATNAQPKTFTISFNDPDCLPEEEPLSYIAQSLAEKIKSNTLKPLEDMYDAPQNVNTSYIQRLLTQGPDYSLNEYGSEDDEEIDSGMDETIKPAASYTTIRYRHCSSAKGSQEPQRFSPGYSPIQFSGTSIVRDSDQMASCSHVASPDRKKGLSERRALNFEPEM